MTQYNLADAYSNRIRGDKAENLEQAIARYTEALKVRTFEAFPQDWAQTQNNLANAYFARIRGDKAENLEKAYTSFKSVIETVESLRSEIVSGDETKRKHAEEWNITYKRMVGVCLDLDRITEAIEYVERSKTRNLVEQILERDSKTFFPPDVVIQLEKYRDEIATGQYQIQNGKAENPQALAQHLQQLRQQRNELQNQYLPIGYGFRFDSFQATLDERTAIIEWYILYDKILAFVVTGRENVTTWKSQPENREALTDWSVQYLQNYYDKKDQWRNNLGKEIIKLASILHIDEILTHIPNHCDKLILIPHWFLHLFPLHALPGNNEDSSCLLDKFAGGVSYAPSCQLLQQVQMRQRPEFQSLFAIQNPTEDLNFTDLEVESILSYFPSHQVLAKEQATKAALSQAATQLKEANYLHFSCHGSFNFNSPQNSYLLLADAYVSPIPVNANPEIYLKVSDTEALDLSKCLTLGDLFEPNCNFSQSRLVVLSACETGLIDFNNTSDEYIGLPSGFLIAGSSNVVSSLWTVNDLSTSFLMIKFIQILKDATDMSVPLALNQAQQWLRNATKDQLQEWVGELHLDNTKQRKIRRQINSMIGEKPFNSHYHWAAFTAVGK
jgi:CHAT domain-containing protein